MRVMNASAEPVLLPYKPEEAMRFVERVGRLCYKSEDKITDTSYVPFIKRLIQNGHTAMLEHSNIIFRIGDSEAYQLFNTIKEFTEKGSTCYIRFTTEPHENIVSGNFRAWRQFLEFCSANRVTIPYFLNLLFLEYGPVFEDLEDAVMPLLYKSPCGTNAMLIPPACIYTLDDFAVHAAYAAHFICDTGISHELVRHRVFSFAQESTRYCNYSKGKFGGEIAVIKPSYLVEGSYSHVAWKVSCLQAEHAYFDMLDHTCTPQEARAVLPKSLKTELFMTGTVKSWKAFMMLRCAPDAHPQMQELARELVEKLIKVFPMGLTEICDDFNRFTQGYIEKNGWLK